MISLSIITKNEERSIARCLMSFSPFVDEMIVCDTGSNDNTMEIAESLGAKIYKYDWCNDFSAARNFSITKVTNPYVLVADADEWLISSGSDLLNTLENECPFVGQIKIINEFELNGCTETSPVWISRLFPREVRYEGRIHEQLKHSLVVKRTEITFRHDGYLPGRKSQKKGRNEDLLRLCLHEKPDDYYYNYQLGKELENSEKYTEASKYYKLALKLTPHHAGVRHDLVVRSIYTFKKARLFNEMISLIERNEFPKSSDYHFSIGDGWLDYLIFYPEQASEILTKIEASWLKCLSLGDNEIYDGAVIGRGSFLAAENLFAFYSSLGDEERANWYKLKAKDMRTKLIKIYS